MPAYILKLFDRVLVRFEARNTGDLPEITDYRIEKDALPLLPMGMKASANALARWLRRRKIPRNRAYVHSLLARLGLGVNSTMAIINISRALSLERFPVELFQFSATLLSSSERVGSPPLLP